MEQPDVSRQMEIFNKYLHGWMESGLQDKWALIRGERVIGIYPTWGAGMRAAQECSKLVPILLQPIQPEPPKHPTRFPGRLVRSREGDDPLPSYGQRSDPRGVDQP